MNIYRFRIARVGLEYRLGDLTIIDNEYTEKFRVEQFEIEDKVIRYEFIADDFLEKKYKPYIEANGTFIRYQETGRTELVYHWDKLRYAISYFPEELIDLESQHLYPVQCKINPLLPYERPYMDMLQLMDYLGLHAIFLHRDYLLLHASYIVYQGQAILFTAPSETGKSTQAELWHRYRGAEVINGDRALVGYQDGRWYAHGYPECGSSGISLNVTAPLAAIVVLQQAPENYVQDMTPGRQVQALVSATKLWTWNLPQINQAMETASRVISQVPVIRLSCRPDEGAVDVLHTYLEQDGSAYDS